MLERPDAVLTSPKRRALETAQLLADVFAVATTEETGLAGGHVAPVLRSLNNLDHERVALVGHEPLLSAIAETLVFGRVTGSIELKKAGAVLLSVDRPTVRAGAGQLLAHLPPRVLRAVAEGQH